LTRPTCPLVVFKNLRSEGSNLLNVSADAIEG